MRGTNRSTVNSKPSLQSRVDALRVPARAAQQRGHGTQVRELPGTWLRVEEAPAEARAAAVVDRGHAADARAGPVHIGLAQVFKGRRQRLQDPWPSDRLPPPAVIVLTLDPVAVACDAGCAFV